MFKNKLTFGYVLFVGIPLLILLGVFAAGADLSAPPAVSGDWIVEPVPNKCAGPLADANPPTLNIYQTGAHLLIAFNDARKTTLNGKLEGGRIAAVSSTTGYGTALRLNAALTGKPGHRLLQGQLSLDGSNLCDSVPFRATRSVK